MSYSQSVDSFIDEIRAEANPCEWRKGCRQKATVMVWCDHHKSGCDYTGFRCDHHFKMLYHETLRQMNLAKLNSSTPVCDACGAIVEIGELSDHLRWASI